MLVYTIAGTIILPFTLLILRDNAKTHLKSVLIVGSIVVPIFICIAASSALPINAIIKPLPVYTSVLVAIVICSCHLLTVCKWVLGLDAALCIINSAGLALSHYFMTEIARDRLLIPEQSLLVMTCSLCLIQSLCPSASNSKLALSKMHRYYSIMSILLAVCLAIYSLVIVFIWTKIMSLASYGCLLGACFMVASLICTLYYDRYKV